MHVNLRVEDRPIGIKKIGKDVRVTPTHYLRPMSGRPMRRKRGASVRGARNSRSRPPVVKSRLTVTGKEPAAAPGPEATKARAALDAELVRLRTVRQAQYRFQGKYAYKTGQSLILKTLHINPVKLLALLGKLSEKQATDLMVDAAKNMTQENKLYVDSMQEIEELRLEALRKDAAQGPWWKRVGATLVSPITNSHTRTRIKQGVKRYLYTLAGSYKSSIKSGAQFALISSGLALAVPSIAMFTPLLATAALPAFIYGTLAYFNGSPFTAVNVSVDQWVTRLEEARNIKHALAKLGVQFNYGTENTESGRFGFLPPKKLMKQRRLAGDPEILYDSNISKTIAVLDSCLSDSPKDGIPNSIVPKHYLMNVTSYDKAAARGGRLRRSHTDADKAAQTPWEVPYAPDVTREELIARWTGATA